MGAWGFGVLEDDVALDTLDVFDAALAAGLGLAEATDRVFEELAEALADSDDAEIVWLALAARQLELGEVDPRVRAGALEHAHTSTRWAEAPPEDRQARKAAVDQLIARL